MVHQQRLNKIIKEYGTTNTATFFFKLKILNLSSNYKKKSLIESIFLQIRLYMKWIWNSRARIMLLSVEWEKEEIKKAKHVT